MPTSFLHLHRARYRSMPWRNGLGVTFEIAREPSGDPEFLWRLSLATISSSGPFSNFARYQRSVTLIDGNGFRLDIAGQEPAQLEGVGATAMFPGDAATSCTLIDGPCHDLSLMVREPGAIGSVARIQCTLPRDIPHRSGTLTALFVLAGEVTVSHADGRNCGGEGHSHLQVAAHDTVLLGAQAAQASVRPVSRAAADLVVLTWTLAGAAR